MDRRLLDYLPAVWQEVRELRTILSAEEPELERLWRLWGQLLHNFFAQTADEAGIARWESMLKLRCGEGESLAARRFRILTVLGNQVPYTWRWLRQKLDSTIGLGAYRLMLDSENYRLSISAGSRYVEELSILDRELRPLLPANLDFVVRQYEVRQNSLTQRPVLCVAYHAGYPHRVQWLPDSVQLHRIHRHNPIAVVSISTYQNEV